MNDNPHLPDASRRAFGAKITRPDGVEIHWEERGQGPAVILCHHYYSFPGVYENLVAELARDLRVVTYDARGTGESTREGPYDLETDSEDLAALVAAVAPGAVAVGIGDGALRAINVAVAQPELIRAVVVTGGNPLMTRSDIEHAGLASSDAVVDAYMELVRRDFRAALRTMLADTSPQLSEDELRERVRATAKYCSQDAAYARLRAFWDDRAARNRASALGDRLWVLHFETPWFPAETLELTRELLPDAHVESVSDGPISRPDITAGVVRGITGSRPQAAGESATRK